MALQMHVLRIPPKILACSKLHTTPIGFQIEKKAVGKVQSVLAEEFPQTDSGSFKTFFERRCAPLLAKSIRNAFHPLENWVLGDVVLNPVEGASLTIEEILHQHGYKHDAHSVVTEDGYILTLHHVYRPAVRGRPKRPVLLVHGFQCSGKHWFLNHRDKTLPHLLTENGYDCWILSLRGSPYSKEHIKLSAESEPYWDFSWQEMASFDIPATIDYILRRVPDMAEQIHCIGHSMGCSVLLGALTEKIEYNAKIRSLVTLSPAVFSANIDNKLLEWVVAPLLTALSHASTAQPQELYRMKLVEIVSRFSPPIQSPQRLAAYMLLKYGRKMGAIGVDSMHPDQIHQLIMNWPASTSAKTLWHGMQCINAKQFQKYDYGPEKNLSVYGSAECPLYDLGKVTCPVATFYGEADGICSKKDVEQLAAALPNCIGNYGVALDTFSHADFLFGRNADTLVYSNVIDILNKKNEQ